MYGGTPWWLVTVLLCLWLDLLCAFLCDIVLSIILKTTILGEIYWDNLGEMLGFYEQWYNNPNYAASPNHTRPPTQLPILHIHTYPSTWGMKPTTAADPETLNRNLNPFFVALLLWYYILPISTLKQYVNKTGEY